MAIVFDRYIQGLVAISARDMNGNLSDSMLFVTSQIPAGKPPRTRKSIQSVNIREQDGACLHAPVVAAGSAMLPWFDHSDCFTVKFSAPTPPQCHSLMVATATSVLVNLPKLTAEGLHEGIADQETTVQPQ